MRVRRRSERSDRILDFKCCRGRTLLVDGIIEGSRSEGEVVEMVY